MAYINKYSGRRISNSEYNDLWDKSDYRPEQQDNSFTNSAIIGAVTDSALLGGLLGGSFTGGLLGDILDGDLGD